MLSGLRDVYDEIGSCRKRSDTKPHRIEDRHPVVLAHPGLPVRRQPRDELGEASRQSQGNLLGIGTSSRPARGGGDGNHGPTYASVLADVGVVSESPARSRCERTKLPEGQAELVGGNTSRASATPLT